MSRRTFPLSIVARLAAAAAFLLVPSAAHPCDSTGCLLSTRGDAGLLRRGGVRIDLSYRSTSLDTPLSGSTRVGEVRRPWADTVRGQLWEAFHRDDAARERFLQVDAAYGVTSRISAFASAPLIAQRSFRIVHGTLAPETYAYDTRGVGDVLAGVRVGLLGGRRSLVGSLAVKLPTGDSQVLAPGVGLILDPMGQPGSGSTDVVVSTQYSWPWMGLSWSLAATRQETTANALDYRYGEESIVSMSASRAVKGPLTASLQVKGFHKNRSVFLGRAVPATGGAMVYVTPALRLAGPGGVSFYAVVPVPVYRYVNENQLGPSAGILLGAAKTF
jgi:hypothetical protein